MLRDADGQRLRRSWVKAVRTRPEDAMSSKPKTTERAKRDWSSKATYRQKHCIDYHETFAAVSRMDSVRYIIASTVLRGWKLHQFDAVTAFLHGDIDSSVYNELLEGFEEPGYVCQLRRSLYGLKQAPRIWYQRVHRVPAPVISNINCIQGGL
ncbi:hypothetical protein VN97_g12383 [Penicillium thymicola]|uniref:Reverse transcriptase Ty1/copia-type domain-containing protein n=1 Tax=Penicillium thymicola TaxID=293382 RepID=A0AAI9T635_PENTH|nr:hypothetical protein VN97_g12383 [Penicillium thymicola]